MKIEHYKTLYLIAGLVLGSTLSLFILSTISVKYKWLISVFAILTVYLLAQLYKVLNLKIEVNQHLISIKSWHPFWGNPKIPSLELPLAKICSYVVVGNIFSKTLILTIRGKKGTKKQYYKLGYISTSTQKQLNTKLKIIDKMPDYKNIFKDILSQKYPEKTRNCLGILNKPHLTAIDILKLNQMIFEGTTNKLPEESNQKYRSYSKTDILQILDYQQKHKFNNSQLARHFKLSRNTVAKWKKMFQT